MHLARSQPRNSGVKLIIESSAGAMAPHQNLPYQWSQLTQVRERNMLVLPVRVRKLMDF